MKSREQLAQELFDGDVRNGENETTSDQIRRIRSVVGHLPDEEQRAVFELVAAMHTQAAREAKARAAVLQAAKQILDGTKPKSGFHAVDGDKTK